MRQFLMLSLALCVLSAITAQAQIPRIVSYQGIVADTAGAPIPDGAYAIRFRLYPAASGGTALWQELKTMQLRRGLISTTLGDQVLFGASVDFSQPYWLGIQIGADPEMQPRIRLTSSGYSIRAEKSDTSLFALAAPTPAVVDSSRIAGAVANNSITSVKILDGTIQRADVVPSFKAPRADTADYALVGTVSGNAGGDLTGTFPNPTIAANAVTTAKLADGAVTSAKIPTAQVVKSLNGVRDAVTFRAQGGATITSSGDTITINAGTGGGGVGVQSIQNTNNTLDVLNPTGPTVTVNVKTAGITTTQIADGTVGSADLADGAVTMQKINQSGATAGRVIKWTGSSWAPGSDSTGGSPSGTAGGDLAGTYPNPTIALSAVTSAKILDGTIQRLDVASNFKAPRADTADYALAGTASGWALTGNAGTTAGVNFVGTTNAQAFDIRTNNILRTRITTKGQIETYNTGQSVFIGEGAGANDDLSLNQNVFVGYRAGFSNITGSFNTASGYNALYSNTTGFYNTASGYSALYSNTTGSLNTANGLNALLSNTTGFSNTANGLGALRSNTTGNSNTASGYNALYSNTTGTINTANGEGALYSNTTGNNNTANGVNALEFNTTGIINTANGVNALRSNTTGSYNTANGFDALNRNTTGISNTASGWQALYSNSTGTRNTADGVSALLSNTTGNENTASGVNALLSNTAGLQNTASGFEALRYNTESYNTAFGAGALFSTTNSQYNVAIGNNAGDSYNNGYNNVFLGAHSDVNGAGYFNVVAIGQATTVFASSQARIGNTATNSIGGFASWTNFSDARYKKNVKEDVKGLDFIMKLRPVTYNLDVSGISQKLNESRGHEMIEQMKTAMADKEKIVQSGFIAQEVEQAAKELGYNFSGVDAPKNDEGLYGLRYAEFVMPLVKAMQEQQKMIEALQKEIKELRGQRKN